LTSSPDAALLKDCRCPVGIRDLVCRRVVVRLGRCWPLPLQTMTAAPIFGAVSDDDVAAAAASGPGPVSVKETFLGAGSALAGLFLAALFLDLYCRRRGSVGGRKPSASTCATAVMSSDVSPPWPSSELSLSSSVLQLHLVALPHGC